MSAVPHMKSGAQSRFRRPGITPRLPSHRIYDGEPGPLHRKMPDSDTEETSDRLQDLAFGRRPHAAKAITFDRATSEFPATSPAPASVVSRRFSDAGADQHTTRDTGGRCADPVQSSPTRSSGSPIDRSRRRRHMELNFSPCARALLQSIQAAGFDDTVHIATRVADNPH
jgi:hypothetical protein